MHLNQMTSSWIVYTVYACLYCRGHHRPATTAYSLAVQRGSLPRPCPAETITAPRMPHPQVPIIIRHLLPACRSLCPCPHRHPCPPRRPLVTEFLRLRHKVINRIPQDLPRALGCPNIHRSLLEPRSRHQHRPQQLRQHLLEQTNSILS